MSSTIVWASTENSGRDSDVNMCGDTKLLSLRAWSDSVGAMWPNSDSQAGLKDYKIAQNDTTFSIFLFTPAISKIKKSCILDRQDIIDEKMSNK